MQVGADSVFIDGAFALILAVIPCSFNDGSEWLGVAAESSKPGMVFVANDLAKFGTLNDGVADKALVAGDGFGIKDANAVQAYVVLSLKEMSKKLIKSADDEGGSAGFNEIMELGGDFM